MTHNADKSEEIRRLIQTIDENPDRLHVDVTPSVLRLSELGLPAASAVIELLDSPDWMTRKRAQRVLEGIVMRRHGWRPGQGYPDPHAGQERTQAVLEANGNYQADADPEVRRRSIELWRRWLETVDDNHPEQEETP